MTLWTDRYRPTKFIDLIGDERVFRNAMSWLKEWDQCVFKNERSAASRRKVAKKRSAQAAFASSGFKGPLINSAPDPLGRPQEKVLLLCGAPGLGKTTMAHVLAQQAGYDIIEINASDDRTTKVVTERIKSALETRTLDAGARQGGGMTFKDNRPTCVIIDEIDGAGGGTEGGFVKALVKLITDARGKKAEIKPLVRPIICICNDLYAPTLRPLRPIARIIRFTTPTPMTIIKRLQTICDLEKLKADLRNLTFLVKIASGDLRSCLNTLQAVQSQSGVASESAIKSAAMVGMKDTGTSVQSVLSKLFKLPRKAKEGESGHQLSELIKDIGTCGEYNRIMQGCFESYLSAKRPTDLWATYEAVHEWLNFYDRLELKIKSENSHGMTSYLQYAIAAWRELMGKISNTAPDYPRIDYEMHLKTAAHQEFLGSFKQAMPPLMRVSFMTEAVISELIPLLMRIISPDLRPVNSQLIRREERDVMMRVVNIMLDLGLNLIQDKGEDGQLTFVLDPPIDLFTQYEGKRPQDIPAPRYGVRQMIAREMDLVLIKRNQGTVATAEIATGDIYGAYKRYIYPSIHLSSPVKVGLIVLNVSTGKLLLRLRKEKK
ncbi:P-loop containing nucleoside triphosphate hydrolase protein [Melampsora americana]|nr:P-loop containing nucleoside triphosphate hydrolase protein [Melampsora americana]